jgi:hypothetical protein
MRIGAQRRTSLGRVQRWRHGRRANAGAQPRGPLPAGSRCPFGGAAGVGCSGLLESRPVLFSFPNNEDQPGNHDG